MEDVENVVIVGAGIAGLATALGLHRMGLSCLVLESADHLRSSGFALTTWTNAWRALDALGVGHELREHHSLIQRLVASSMATGASTFQTAFDTQGKSGKHELRCLARNRLLDALGKELPHGTIRFRANVVSIEEDGKLKLLHLADGSTLKAKVLVGCDGVSSIVAKWLGLNPPIYAGRSAVRGITEYPEGHSFKPEIMQFIGDGFRCGFLPFDQNHVYWFFTWSPSPKGTGDVDVDESPEKLKQFVLSNLGKIRPEIVDVVERSELSGILASKLRYRSPLELLLSPVHRGSVCLAGDAFHPMTPELGQGGCTALEDGVVLARCLGEALLGKEHQRIEHGVERYVRERKWRCVEVVTTAWIVGTVQQSSGAMMNFLRDKFLGSVMARKLLSIADFDCGEIPCVNEK